MARTWNSGTATRVDSFASRGNWQDVTINGAPRNGVSLLIPFEQAQENLSGSKGTVSYQPHDIVALNEAGELTGILSPEAIERASLTAADIAKLEAAFEELPIEYKAPLLPAWEKYLQSKVNVLAQGEPEGLQSLDV